MKKKKENNIFNPVTEKKVKKGYIYTLYVLLLLIVIGCILPFSTQSNNGYSESVNYIYNDGSIGNGVYILVCLLIALFAMFKKFYKGTLAAISVCIGIIVYEFIDVQLNIDKITHSGLVNFSWGIGFYLVTISLALSFIVSVILSKGWHIVTVVAGHEVETIEEPKKKKEKKKEKVEEVKKKEEVTEENQTDETKICKYCGSPRKKGLYCKSCGGRY